MKTNDSTYSNPILYFDYSDPDAIRVGNDYYMIASSFSNAPGIPVLHSRDLVSWELINYVLKALPDTRYDVPVHGCGVFAPSIRYHEGLFYVCFPMPDEGIFMSTAKDPYEEWSKPVNIRPGAGWIDPCPFWDDDGRAYLVAGVAKSRIGYNSVLHIVELQPDGMGLIGDERRIFDGNENGQYTIEGPKMYKRNGWYYIFAPAGGVKTGWQTVLRSKSPFGPYEYKVVMRQGSTCINGPHQGAWVDTVTGEDWFLHFQDVYSAGRITHLQPMHWENDWPVIGIARDGNDYGEPVQSYRRPNTGHSGVHSVPAASDSFEGKKLGLQWQWNANSKADWYGFHELGLQLFAVPKKTVYGDIPNLLLQKWPAPEFSCITTIHLDGLGAGDEAGVISMGMDYGLISFVRNADAILVKTVLGHQIFDRILVKETKEETTLIEQLPIDTKTVSVRYLVERVGTRDLSETERNFPKELVHLSYSINGTDYKTVCSMTSTPGRWVGVKNGVFCVSSQEGSKGHAAIASVLYEFPAGV